MGRKEKRNGNPSAAVSLVLRGGFWCSGRRGRLISSPGSSGTCSPFDVRKEKGGKMFLWSCLQVCYLSYLILSHYPSPRFLRVFRRHATRVSAGLTPRLGILHMIRKYTMVPSEKGKSKNTLLSRKCAVKFDSSHPDEKSI